MRQRDQLSKKKKSYQRGKSWRTPAIIRRIANDIVEVQQRTVSLGPKPNLMSLHSALFFSLTLFAILEFRDFSS